MSTLSLRLPESLHRQIRELAERDNVSINQFIATAAAEKTAALLTIEYLEGRARRGDAASFGSILARVPDVAPVPGDELLARQESQIAEPAADPWLAPKAKRRPRGSTRGRRPRGKS